MVQFWEGVDTPVGVQTTLQLQLIERRSVSLVRGSCRFSGAGVEIPHVFLDKVVDMPVIVNDRVLHSGSALIQLIACFRGHSSCATQTGTMLPAFLLMAAMMGFLTLFASFFALLRLCRS